MVNGGGHPTVPVVRHVLRRPARAEGYRCRSSRPSGIRHLRHPPPGRALAAVDRPGRRPRTGRRSARRAPRCPGRHRPRRRHGAVGHRAVPDEHLWLRRGRPPRLAAGPDRRRRCRSSVSCFWLAGWPLPPLARLPSPTRSLDTCRCADDRRCRDVRTVAARLGTGRRWVAGRYPARLNRRVPTGPRPERGALSTRRSAAVQRGRPHPPPGRRGRRPRLTHVATAAGTNPPAVTTGADGQPSPPCEHGPIGPGPHCGEPLVEGHERPPGVRWRVSVTARPRTTPKAPPTPRAATGLPVRAASTTVR